MEIKNRELHRITSTAIIHKPPHQNFGSEGKDGRYLIVRRALDKKNFPGRWIVPGGGLEVDDYIDLPKTTPDSWYFVLEKSLRREIKEEVNLEVGKLKYLLDAALISTEGIPILILSFYCDYKSGEVKLNDENIDYKWVTYEEAKDYDLPPHQTGDKRSSVSKLSKPATVWCGGLVEGLLEEIEMVDKILKGDNSEEIEYHYKNN